MHLAPRKRAERRVQLAKQIGRVERPLDLLFAQHHDLPSTFADFEGSVVGIVGLDHHVSGLWMHGADQM
ncbi:MAG: hypothetical protein DMG04_22770 [Acidobacteria bacterium]|nr:MAG: hypothetical protein DMG04_22770 [Acidobacteriota bacterium]